MEVFRRLVPLPVFKTGVARNPGQAGSIPVRLRTTVEGPPMTATDDRRRQIPRTDTLLADPRFRDALATFGRPAVKRAIAAAQQRARDGQIAAAEVADAAAQALSRHRTRAVLNATGVVLHTNLGRAGLPAAAVDAL